MSRTKQNQPTHLPGGMGRLPVEWPPVPHVPAYKQRAIEAWLQDHRNIRRPLTVTTPLLAVICALYELGHPLPTRRSLSESFGCNIFSVDGAISTALGENEIIEEYRYAEGAVAKHASIRRRRFLIPSLQLFEVWKNVSRSKIPTDVYPPADKLLKLG